MKTLKVVQNFLEEYNMREIVSISAVHNCGRPHCKLLGKNMTWSFPPKWMLKQIKRENYKNIKVKYE